MLNHKKPCIKLNQKSVYDSNQSNPGNIYKTSLKFEQITLWTEMETYHSDPLKQAMYSSLDKITPLLEEYYEYSGIDLSPFKILSNDSKIYSTVKYQFGSEREKSLLSEKITLLTVFDTFYDDPKKHVGKSSLDYLLEVLSDYVLTADNSVSLSDKEFRIIDSSSGVYTKTLYLYDENPHSAIDKE